MFDRSETFRYCRTTIRLESIMLHNLPIMLFGISLIFYLLCLFLCFLDMDYADISCFKLCNFAENNHYRNEIYLDLQKHLLLFAYKICTFILLAWHMYYLTCICIFGALKFKPIIKSSYR